MYKIVMSHLGKRVFKLFGYNVEIFGEPGTVKQCRTASAETGSLVRVEGKVNGADTGIQRTQDLRLG